MYNNSDQCVCVCVYCQEWCDRYSLLHDVWTQFKYVWLCFMLSRISPWKNDHRFARRHFQMQIHEWKVVYFDSNFT